MVVLSVLLGVTVGPASATGLAPNLATWPISHHELALNASTETIWPSILNGGSIVNPSTNQISTVLASNLFSYWGSTTPSGIQATPELCAIPGDDAVRTLHARLRGPYTLYQPLYTVATVQHSIIAKLINVLRLDWYEENNHRCARKHGGLCNYKDIQWSISALQSNVFTACRESVSETEIFFPSINWTATSNTPGPLANNLTTTTHSSAGTKLEWFDLNDTASVGVVVTLGSGSGASPNTQYACSIIAQWTKARASSTWLGSPYLVDGFPTNFFIPVSEGSTYVGSQVKLDPSWTTALFNRQAATSNRSDFDTLFAAGDMVGVAAKVEAVLAVLTAGYMSEIGTDTAFMNSTAASVKSENIHNLTFSTTATGYAYGLSTTDKFSVSSLAAVIILLAYCLVATVYLSLRCTLKWPYVNAWRSLLDNLVLALHSPPDQDVSGTAEAKLTRHFTREPFVLRTNAGKAELVLANGPSEKIAKGSNVG